MLLKAYLISSLVIYLANLWLMVLQNGDEGYDEDYTRWDAWDLIGTTFVSFVPVISWINFVFVTIQMVLRFTQPTDIEEELE